MFQPSHGSDCPIVWFISVVLVLEVNNSNHQSRAYVVIVASSSLTYRHIAVGKCWPGAQLVSHRHGNWGE